MLPRPDARASGARPGRLSDEGDNVSVGATTPRIAAIEAEAAARKHRLAQLSMSPVGRTATVAVRPEAARGAFQVERPVHFGNRRSAMSSRNQSSATPVLRGRQPAIETESRMNGCIREPRTGAADPQGPFGLSNNEWLLPEVQEPAGAVSAERSGTFGRQHLEVARASAFASTRARSTRPG